MTLHPVLPEEVICCHIHTVFIFPDVPQQQASSPLKYLGVKDSWIDEYREDESPLILQGLAFHHLYFKHCIIQEGHLMLGEVEKISTSFKCASFW